MAGQMKQLIFLLLLSGIIFISCGSDETEDNKTETVTRQVKNEPHVAKVVDKMDANNYTYLQVIENNNTYWIAVPSIQIETGDMIYFSQSMEMKNFKSETLNRTFESVLFVQDARKSSNPTEMKSAHSNTKTGRLADLTVEPVEGGITIGEIFNSKNDIPGKKVKVKGKVVKFNKQIMNRNWIHIQDGTGDEDNFDLVITTLDDAKVGDIIVAEGIVSTDKDFGAGYFFPVIIEKAEIIKE